jgi:hypothetical protein
MFVRVLSPSRLVLGADPLQPSLAIDLSLEKVGKYQPDDALEISNHSSVSSVPSLGASRITRRTGDYWFEIKGRRTDCGSLRQLLAQGLCALEEARPGTLEKLSHIKPRSRRIVARDPNALFDKERLVRYAARLMNGWWFGTNNSADETNVWLERACSCAGLKWDDDFKTSLTPTLEDLIA